MKKVSRLVLVSSTFASTLLPLSASAQQAAPASIDWVALAQQAVAAFNGLGFSLKIPGGEEGGTTIGISDGKFTLDAGGSTTISASASGIEIKAPDTNIAITPSSFGLTTSGTALNITPTGLNLTAAGGEGGEGATQLSLDWSVCAADFKACIEPFTKLFSASIDMLKSMQINTASLDTVKDLVAGWTDNLSKFFGNRKSVSDRVMSRVVKKAGSNFARASSPSEAKRALAVVNLVNKRAARMMRRK
jgi:hypothetical protein